jgi:hypothetical protein
MEGPLGKIYSIPAVVLLVVGMVLSAFLFYSLMKAAENGNAMMVVILAIAISIVAFVISRALKFQNLKKF